MRSSYRATARRRPSTALSKRAVGQSADTASDRAGRYLPPDLEKGRPPEGRPSLERRVHEPFPLRDDERLEEPASRAGEQDGDLLEILRHQTWGDGRAKLVVRNPFADEANRPLDRGEVDRDSGEVGVASERGPVEQDRVQYLEFARRFSSRFGGLLPEPEPIVEKRA